MRLTIEVTHRCKAKRIQAGESKPEIFEWQATIGCWRKANDMKVSSKQGIKFSCVCIVFNMANPMSHMKHGV